MGEICSVMRGTVLLVDGRQPFSERGVDVAATGLTDDDVIAGGDLEGTQSTGGGNRGGLAMAATLALIGEACNMSIYHALSYLSSQLLVAAIHPEALSAMARWQESHRWEAWRRCERSVRIACLCGACSWHVPPAWLCREVDVAVGMA